MTQAQNDALRTTMRGGRIVLTAKAAALSQRFYGEVITAIQTTQNFGNDEHSYGEVTVRGEEFYWLIEPDGPRLTMTIGHLSEFI